MTPVIAAGRGLRLLRTPPPAEIAARAAARAGQPPRATPAFRLGWLAAHVGYGAAGGAAYAALRPLLPASPVAAGLVYGGAVWAASYLGLMPALGLYPWPRDDARSRLAVMVLAHAVYGGTLAVVARHLNAVGPGERRSSAADRGEIRLAPASPTRSEAALGELDTPAAPPATRSTGRVEVGRTV